METDVELSKFVFASQYTELITGVHMVQTEGEIQDECAHHELHVKTQRYETLVERTINKHAYITVIHECRLGKEMLEVLPSGRSNSEWLTEPLARLERMTLVDRFLLEEELLKKCEYKSRKQGNKESKVC